MRAASILSISIFIVCLSGCTGADINKAPASADIDFTGVGKPTETITTQYGTFDIYDPRQDPELIEMADVLWVAEVTPDREDMNVYRAMIAEAQQLRVSDCLRAGSSALPFALTHIHESTIPEHCSDIAFGKIEMTSCERDHSEVRMRSPAIAFSYAHEMPITAFLDKETRQNSTRDELLDTLFKGTCGPS